MKQLFCFFLLAASGLAEQAKPLIAADGPVISQPDLRHPLGPEWTVAKGKWKPRDGVLYPSEIPKQMHSAVLRVQTGPGSVVIECDFRFMTGKIFHVGCDGGEGDVENHIGRVDFTQSNAQIFEDSGYEHGQKNPRHVLAEARGEVKADEWQHVRVEFAGSQLAGQINGRALQAEHPFFATPKTRWWLAAGGSGLEVKNLKVSQGLAVVP